MKLRTWLGMAYALGACDANTAAPDVKAMAGGAPTTTANEPSAGQAATQGGVGGAPPTIAGAGAENHAGSGAGQSPQVGGAGASLGGEPSAGVGGSLPGPARRVLLYHFSTLVIDTVPEQLELLKTALESWGYEAEDSVDPRDLDADALARFDGIAMINTCFEPFGAGRPGSAEAAALSAFVERGGALFGTHCASVTYQSAQPPHPYNELLGGRGGDGYFDGESACLTLEDHPSAAMLPASFSYRGNLDNTDFLAMDAKVLVRCRWSGGSKKDVAVSWSRTLGKGRIFYTNFAKTADDLRSEALTASHVLAGLRWTLEG